MFLIVGCQSQYSHHGQRLHVGNDLALDSTNKIVFEDNNKIGS